MNKIDPDSKIIQSKETNSTPKRRLMDVLKENLTCEMYHALFEVFDSPHYVIKIYLSLFLLLAYGLASYTTVNIILGYLNYGVTTTTRTVYETPVDFPKVTVCNINPFTTQYAFNLLKKFDRNSILNSNSLDSTPFKSLLFTSIGQVATDNDTNKMLISHSLNDILISCKYNQEVCTASDFTWYFDLYYGNCYSFNSGSNSTGQSVALKQSSIPGLNFGLQLELYVNYYEQLALFNSATGGLGLLVRVDNESHIIDHIMGGIQVSASQATFVSLGREFKTSLAQPYSDCALDPENPVFSSDLYDLIRSSKYDYTQSFCIEQCLQDLIVQKCNCSFPALVSLFNSSRCIEIGCGMMQYSKVFAQNNYIQKLCEPRCPLECNSTTFTYTTANFALVNNIYANIIRSRPNLASDFISRNLSESAAKESVAQLNVFYDSLTYRVSEESPQWDMLTLLANLGGNLGLYLGVSMFSVCEWVTTLLEIYFWKKH